MYSYIYIYILELLIQPHLPNTSLCTILKSENYSHITRKFDGELTFAKYFYLPRRRRGAAHKTDGNSQVSSLVIFHSKFSSELTFENFSSKSSAFNFHSRLSREPIFEDLYFFSKVSLLPNLQPRMAGGLDFQHFLLSMLFSH